MVLVGLRSAGGDAARTFMVAGIILAIIVVVGWPALSTLPWWKASAAVVVAVVGGPLLAIGVFAVLANAFMLPFVVRERRHRRWLDAVFAAALDGDDPHDPSEDSSGVLRRGSRLLTVEDRGLWKAFEDRPDLLEAADRPGPFQVLLLRLILKHAMRGAEFERLMARHRALLEAEELGAEERTRLGWWADAGTAE